MATKKEKRKLLIIALFFFLSTICCDDDRITNPTSIPDVDNSPINNSDPASRPIATPTPTPMPTPPPISVPDVFLIGAGDIAYCPNLSLARATAALLNRYSGDTIFTAGDNVQGDGSAKEFSECFDPTWGKYKNRILFSAPGNHDYNTAAAQAYYNYFGGLAAGDEGRGYYSRNLGAWIIYVINSNSSVLDTSSYSAQYRWLKDKLQTDKANGNKCSMAIWHHPLYSSGPERDHIFMKDIWQLLYQYNVEFVVNGHDHKYERFAPQDSNGRLDIQNGIRQFTVGTGGMTINTYSRERANSEAKILSNGVIRLTLKSSSYDWEFIPINSTSQKDFGTDVCRP